MSDNPEDALELLTDEPPKADWTVILAHGAGQGMDSPFMAHIAEALARAGVRVIRFEFRYMAEMRRTSKRKPPNREPVLLERWNQVIDRKLTVGTDPRRLLIGGKSLGGRMASLIADERGVAGLVCLGYPFHPPGKPDRPRTEHLRVLRTPAAHLSGHPRQLRQTGRGGRIRARLLRPPRLDRGRRSQLLAAQAIRPHLGAEPGPGGGGDCPLRRFAVSPRSSCLP
jgi:predicted alpha/beta-hydrolase family hydrolase